MHHLTILAPFLALVASTRGLIVPTPQVDPEYVKIKGVSVLGSGCPAGTADVQIDATGTLFEVTFSTYEVETGPGTSPVDWRKNCKLTINMEFTPGFSSVTHDLPLYEFN